ncbi:MAG: serine hydrolase [Gemmatimonadota bacterium]
MRVRSHTSLRQTFAVMALAAACGGGSTPVDVTPVPRDGATYVPQGDWRVAEPEQVGIDASAIARLTRHLASNEIRGLSSLLIVREGYLVTERYFNGSSRDDVHTMQSVSKSVTSLVTGIAVDHGRVDPEARVFTILPAYGDLAASDTRKQSVTLRHLLEMRAGINFYEQPYSGSPLEQLNNSRDDWVRIALQPAMNAAPGDRWQYNSGGVIVLAAAVQRLTGTPFDEFARTHLFRPIGITSERWYRSPFDGLPHTGGGLSLRAVDLARIGYLVLREGRWGQANVVSRAWLDASLTPASSGVAGFGGRRADYGRLWWLYQLDANAPFSWQNAVFTAIGNLNQWLFVVPRLDLVVVVTGASNESSPASFFFSDILPAVRPLD